MSESFKSNNSGSQKRSQDVPSAKAMRRLWARMASIYGHKWTTAYGESFDAENGKVTIPGDTWARGLNGVSEMSVAKGLQSCLMSSDPWPPTLPAFRAMCLGIPSFATLRREITHRNEQRSPFARQVWEFLDGYLFAKADVEKADRMLREAYALGAEYVMRGGHLPEPVVGELAAPEKRKPKPASEATAKASLAQIAELLGESEDQEGGANE